MAYDDDDTIDWNTVPPAKMFHIVLRELVDMRSELKQEFKRDLAKLKTEIADVKTELKKDIKDLRSDLHTLRIEVHQNHSTFIANQTAMDKRVTKLEMAAV